MKIPLILTGWEYDPETKRISASFADLAPYDDPDPANHESTQTIPLASAVLDSINSADPQIAELNDVVDQLVLDMLMGGM